MILLLLRELFSFYFFLFLSYIWLLQITEHLHLGATTKQKPFFTNWTKGERITENWPDNVWTCEKKPKYWCLLEKTNKSNDKLSWTKTALKRRYCISSGENWPFLKFSFLPWSNRYFKLESFFDHTPKAEKQSYLSIGFRMRGTEKRAEPNQALGQPILAECGKILQIYQKKCCQNWKEIGVQFFFPDLEWKLS